VREEGVGVKEILQTRTTLFTHPSLPPSLPFSLPPSLPPSPQSHRNRVFHEFRNGGTRHLVSSGKGGKEGGREGGREEGREEGGREGGREGRVRQLVPGDQNEDRGREGGREDGVDACREKLPLSFSNINNLFPSLPPSLPPFLPPSLPPSLPPGHGEEQGRDVRRMEPGRRAGFDGVL